MKLKNQLFSFVVGIFCLLVIFTASCKTDPPLEERQNIQIEVEHFYNGKEFQINAPYQSAQGNELSISKFDYYLSNVVAIKTDGTKELVSEIVLISNESSSSLKINGSILPGTYSAITFDLGVREDLNSSDPATFSTSHPLSIYNNMYWGWASMYVFAKMEGIETPVDTTASVVIHTGLQELYRPGLRVNRTFTVPNGGTKTDLKLDIYAILSAPDYTFDLVNNGQTHTMDNLPLAVSFMDNFQNAFY